MTMFGDSPIDNTRDLIDSREIVARLEYLSDLMKSSGISPDETGEMHVLRKVTEQGSLDYRGWEAGVTLIRWNYFTQYVRDGFADMHPDLWSRMMASGVVIDWEATAKGYRTDYSDIEFGNVTYYAR